MLQNILKNKKSAYFIALLCTLLWGTAFPFIKLGYSSFAIADDDTGTKLLFAGFRFAAAGVMVLAVVWIKEKRFPVLQKSDVLPVTSLALVQTAAQYIFTYIGIGFTSGTNTSIITACASFFTVLSAPLFFKNDRLGGAKLAGCALGFAGVLAINRGAQVSTDTLFGDVMILFSTISAAAGNLLSKKIARNRSPFRVTAYQLLIGGCVMTAIGFLCGGSLRFDNFKSLFILLWLAFVSAAAFALWTGLLKYHPASKICIFNLLVPVFGTVLSGLLLGENVFRIETAVSLALISAGIVFVNLPGKRREKNEN